MDTLLSLEHIIFDLREDNINSSAEEIMKLFDCEYPFSFYFIICNISFYFYCSHKYEPDNLIHFLSEIKKLSNSDEDILQIFVDTLINFFPKSGANYILQKMIDEKIISSDVVENINFLYFIHCDPKIVKIFNKDPLNYYLYKDKIFNNICKTLQKNYEELSKNDWKLHKQLIEEGVNPNEIAKIIRNDEIEKLQEISSQTNFDFNQTIEPSLYERCSFINQKDVTLIEYAAFFGSVKCFKYLLMNGANVNDTAKYSIAGGNEEIIHLCEQNHSTFEGVYETAIQFHKNDIFKYVYENKLEEINNLEEIEKKCITYYNFEILSFLINEGKKVNNSIMKISDSIIKTSANSGNLYLVKYFLQLDPIPKDILPYSANSMNHELVKLFIEKGNDVNVKNV